MEEQLFDFLATLVSGTLGILDSLLAGIPVAKDAILWMVFVMLVMNLIVIPIRGAGSSDRARAERVMHKRNKSDQVLWGGSVED